MKKYIIFISVVLLVLPGASIFLSACNSSGVVLPAFIDNTFFSEIAVMPEKYNGQTVTFTGFFYDGFEQAVVAEYLEPYGSLPGNYQPAGTLIWREGSVPAEVISALYFQPNDPTGYPAHYGKVEITGIFKYGGKYGHMGAYKYQLQIKDVKLLEWVPTNK